MILCPRRGSDSGSWNHAQEGRACGYQTQGIKNFVTLELCCSCAFSRWKHRGLVTSSASVYLSLKWGSYSHLEGMLSVVSMYLFSAQVGI